MEQGNDRLVRVGWRLTNVLPAMANSYFPTFQTATYRLGRVSLAQIAPLAGIQPYSCLFIQCENCPASARLAFRVTRALQLFQHLIKNAFNPKRTNL
jgi:hypothetical protein